MESLCGPRVHAAYYENKLFTIDRAGHTGSTPEKGVYTTAQDNTGFFGGIRKKICIKGDGCGERVAQKGGAEGGGEDRPHTPNDTVLCGCKRKAKRGASFEGGSTG